MPIVTVKAYLEDESVIKECYNTPDIEGAKSSDISPVAHARYDMYQSVMGDGVDQFYGEIDGELQDEPSCVVRIEMSSSPYEWRFTKSDRELDDYQQSSLIHNICEQIVWIALSNLFPENTDFTEQWETISSHLGTETERNFNFETLSKSEELAHDIAKKANEEFQSWLSVGTANVSIAASEGYDRWLERMEEDNWE